MFQTYPGVGNAMVTLCVLVAVLRTRSSWPGFVHASPPAGDGEADYKHDVISLSVLISLSQGQERLTNTQNNGQ